MLYDFRCDECGATTEVEASPFRITDLSVTCKCNTKMHRIFSCPTVINKISLGYDPRNATPEQAEHAWEVRNQRSFDDVREGDKI